MHLSANAALVQLRLEDAMHLEEADPAARSRSMPRPRCHPHRCRPTATTGADENTDAALVERRRLRLEETQQANDTLVHRVLREIAAPGSMG